jgi:hypothetical protein
MRDDLRDFRGLYAALQRAIEIEWQLDCLVARNQRGEDDYAAVTRIKAGTFPNLAQQALLRELIEGRCDRLTDGPARR